jgi:hypothetical protein
MDRVNPMTLPPEEAQSAPSNGLFCRFAELLQLFHPSGWRVFRRRRIGGAVVRQRATSPSQGDTVQPILLRAYKTWFFGVATSPG